MSHAQPAPVPLSDEDLESLLTLLSFAPSDAWEAQLMLAFARECVYHRRELRLLQERVAALKHSPPYR